MSEQNNSGERLATLEAEVRGMRNDFLALRDEMKQTMGTFLGHVTSMQREYISRAEFDREMVHRDLVEKDRIQRIDDLEQTVERIGGRPSWSVAGVFTGAVAIIAVLVTVLVVFLDK